MMAVKSATRPINDENRRKPPIIRHTAHSALPMGKYTYLISDEEQAVLPFLGGMTSAYKARAWLRGEPYSGIRREHEHFCWDSQTASCNTLCKQPDNAVWGNSASGSDDEQHERTRGYENEATWL